MNEAARVPPATDAAPEAANGRRAAAWRGDGPEPVPPRPGPLGWLLVAVRATLLTAVLVGGVLMLVLLRPLERLLAGPLRPATGPLVQVVSRLCLLVLGISWRRVGRPMRRPGAVVANHAGWLDILVLNAAMPVFFVSKAEVAGWPGINILTRVTGTHFVVRDPRLTRTQAHELAARMRAGHQLLFFPEATSSDSLRVLPFKPGLFQSFLADDMPAGLAVQPVSVHYSAPRGRDPRFYGWYGDMALGPHLLAVLAQMPQGRVQVTLHPALTINGQDRKALAAHCEAAVRSAGPEHAEA